MSRGGRHVSSSLHASPTRQSGLVKWSAQVARSRQPEAPLQLNLLGDSNARTGLQLELHFWPRVWCKDKRRPIQRAPIMRMSDRQRLPHPPWTRTQKARILLRSALPHRLNAMRRLKRPYEHASPVAFFEADEIQAPMQAVGAIDIDVARRPEQGCIASGFASVAVRGRITLVIGLGFDDHASDTLYQQQSSDQRSRDQYCILAKIYASNHAMRI